jgi:uncharacterized surface protein with fasciclin (FAS1) repeats
VRCRASPSPSCRPNPDCAGGVLRAVLAAITAGGGKAVVTTVQGGKLTASVMGNKVMLTDAKGRTSHVTAADLDATNGVIHVVDTVLLP